MLHGSCNAPRFRPRAFWRELSFRIRCRSGFLEGTSSGLPQHAGYFVPVDGDRIIDRGIIIYAKDRGPAVIRFHSQCICQIDTKHAASRPGILRLFRAAIARPGALFQYRSRRRAGVELRRVLFRNHSRRHFIDSERTDRSGRHARLKASSDIPVRHTAPCASDRISSIMWAIYPASSGIQRRVVYFGRGIDFDGPADRVGDVQEL